jgi:drug/metabolite transporter (DMT)-like permease
MIYQFILGALVYGVIVCLSYYKPIQATHLYMPLGLALALGVNYLWLSIARASLTPSETLVKGFMWDAMIVLAYGVLPVLFFGAKLTLVQGIGVGCIVLGMVLTKL